MRRGLLYYDPDPAREWMTVAAHKGTQSVFALDGQELFEGIWDPRELAGIVVGDRQAFWRGRRVLDIGGNTGGLSIELARLGASVTIAEPDPYGTSITRTRHLVERVAGDEGLDVTIEGTDLFSCHQLDRHDVGSAPGVVDTVCDGQATRA